MTSKITHYKHTKKYKDRIPEWNEFALLSGDKNIYLSYFKYIPIDNILDTWGDVSTHNNYLDYVMTKYGTTYHNVIKKMEKGVELEPINIQWYDYQYYKKNKIYKVDLDKFQKAYLLASRHMRYTHIPVIITKGAKLSNWDEGSSDEDENPPKRLKTN